MVTNKDMKFFMENLKMKRKKDKIFWPSKGDLNPRFSVIFPAMIWIFIESERSNQNKLLKEIRLYYTVVDFTDSANDDAGKTEETEIIMSDFDQQHSQRYTYRVLQTIQMKLILLYVWQSGPSWAVPKLL